MRDMLEDASMIMEGIAYLLCSPFIYITCKTLETVGLLDKDDND